MLFFLIISSKKQSIKDMERWAQSQNKKKDTVKKPVTATPIIAVKLETNGKVSSSITNDTNGKQDEPLPITTTSTTNEDIKKVLIKVTVLHESLKQIIMYIKY